MAHLNCLPPRAAGVNNWFFLLAHLVEGVGIKQNVKREMMLRKRERRRNECAKLWFFPRNCEMEMVATCSTTDGNGSYHGLAPSFFEDMTRCRRQKHCWRRPDNPNGPLKFHKYHVYLPLLRLFTSARSRPLFRGWRQRQLPRTRTVVFRRDDTLSTSKTSL